MEKRAEKITPQKAREIMDTEENYVLLDVREKDEFAQGHILGAALLPCKDLASQAEEKLPQKDQLILIYCRSGRRSAVAADCLVRLGYTNVKDFGGILDWPYGLVK